MNDLERQLGDAVAEDRMTGADAEHVRTFAQFLAETPAGGGQVTDPRAFVRIGGV